MESPPRHPVAGIDYPRTFQEFDAWFGSETACREYIRRLRWPDGFVCPPLRGNGRAAGNVAKPAALSSLRSAGIADGWNCVAGRAQAAADVVSRHVVRHQPEERRPRAGSAAGAWPWQL